MRVIISAGGTGGHIYPAISIINKIKEYDKSSEFLYIGTTDRMESEIIPKLSIPYFGIEMKGLSKNVTKSFKSLRLLLKSMNIVRNKIKEFNPDIVIGVGGYVTFPVIYEAHKLGYKTMIHEQNSISGKTNRQLAKYASVVAVSLPRSINYFPKEKVVFTGNPRSSEIIKAQPIKKKELGLSDDKKLVLIVMGSLGSMTINEELLDIVPKFKNKNYEVILVTGKNYYDNFKDIKINNVKIVPFLDNMLNVLKVCDLIVTRAGASTIAEITSIGLPSILVPSPYVANNHQFYNAKELVDAGASLMLLERDFKSDSLLEKIDLVLNDKDMSEKMHEASLKLGKPNSSDEILQVIINILGSDLNGEYNK
ncbi:MAG: undecaprenyldiphospho-muramoylpentapeptide beta-N-acetylglucosaminyltransferase [Bacilli bacterium]|nr:undecaprenyldiphospho-muramoylpentapeptide beta-N-acetylglucosaminyltransferase [Bacilli bacterium]